MKGQARGGNRKGARGPKHRWLLSGIARCGKCGSQHVRVLKLSNGRRGYSCRSCYGVTRDAERTDAMVETAVLERLRDPAFATALRPTADVTALNERREKIGRELEEIAGERLTVRQRAIMSAPLLDELDAVEARLSAAYREAGLEGIADVPDPAGKWDAPDGFTMEQKRAIVRILLEITLLPVKHTAEDGSVKMMGPPEGWKPGTSWFIPGSVQIRPRSRS